MRQRRKEIEGKSEGGDEDGTLMSTLVAGMIRGEITEEEAIDNVVLLVFAAHDTTSYAIAMIFKMLALSIQNAMRSSFKVLEFASSLELKSHFH